MLTKNNLESNDDSGNDRLRETDDFEKSFRAKMRDEALRLYKNELNTPTNLDLGLHGVSRASLRVLCQNAVLESSSTLKKKYSYSAISSVNTIQDEKNVMSALRTLQKERLIVTRLGFPDKAMELDREIEVMRAKVKIARDKEEGFLLEQRMRLLGISHMRKQMRLEYILGEEVKQMKQKFADEEEKMTVKIPFYHIYGFHSLTGALHSQF